MNLSRSGTQNTGLYDLQSVVAHEVNEALGSNSGLNGLQNNDPTPTGAIGTMDLYRYSAPGVRSFNTNAATNAYFSVDGGATNLSASTKMLAATSMTTSLLAALRVFRMHPVRPAHS